ncbi:N-acetyltransferase [Rhynchospora pubera]|uniref:N-acetyltransferase n=1 Tax=Rhynchospora pubera TaxID=906938 RepID=A0AAV8E4F7_9POAL|nr:N-acetyltransferase [Rhynchospora pubera]
MSLSSTTTIWAELRHADASEVPFLRVMIHQLANYVNLSHLCSASDASLLSSLFPSPPLPPFFSFTTLLLHLSSVPPLPSPQTLSITSLSLSFPSPIADPDRSAFSSPLRKDDHTIAGFIICFPRYSTYLAKPGLHIEDVFVREPWRRKGLGRFMITAVAKKAAEMGMGRVEWCVLDWNSNAKAFYESMGAVVLSEQRLCRFSGPALERFKSGNGEERKEDDSM